MKIEVSVLNFKKGKKKKRGRPSNQGLTEEVWLVYKETRNIKEAAKRLGMTESRVAYHVKKKRILME